MADEIRNQAAENEAPEQNVNELRQIRVDKLTALQEAGKDPFQVTVAQQD
jgi:lysyl-tRNA synthetase class 2